MTRFFLKRTRSGLTRKTTRTERLHFLMLRRNRLSNHHVPIANIRNFQFHLLTHPPPFFFSSTYLYNSRCKECDYVVSILKILE